MLRLRKAVGKNGIITLLAGVLFACNQGNFEGAAPSKSKPSKTSTVVEEDDAIAEPITKVPTAPTSLVAVKTLCSNLLTNVNTTNLRMAESGVSIKMYRREDDATSDTPALTMNDPAVMQRIRQDILTRRTFKFTPNKILPDGTYDLLICDSKFGDQCARKKNDGKDTIISGGKDSLYRNESHGRPYGLGALGYAPRVTVLKGVVTAPRPVVVLANRNDGDRSQAPLFAQTFSQAYTGELAQQNSTNSIASFYGGSDASDVGECDESSSPLIVDLSGRGLELSSPEEGVNFDIKGNGDPQKISWLKNPEQYFVVLDDLANNSKGVAEIRSTLELFGNRTVGPDGKVAANGFEALAKYDTNSDKRIDRKDAIFSSLRLWHDSNRDGIGQDTELITLDQAGLVELDLNYSNSEARDLFGNEFRQTSKAKNASGRTFELIDVWFQTL